MKKAFKDLTLADHWMFAEVMCDHEICKLFLSELLEKNIKDIVFTNREHALTNSRLGRGTRFDVLATDDSGNRYDDGAHVIFLNSSYSVSNVSKPVEEFLGILNNCIPNECNTKLAEDISTKIADIKTNKGKEGLYMTLGEIIDDEREEAKAEGKAEGKAEVLNTLGISPEEYEAILKKKEQELN